MAPPRLTGALRSFSSVSKKEDVTEHLYDLKVSPVSRTVKWHHRSKTTVLHTTTFFVICAFIVNSVLQINIK